MTMNRRAGIITALVCAAVGAYVIVWQLRVRRSAQPTLEMVDEQASPYLQATEDNQLKIECMGFDRASLDENGNSHVEHCHEPLDNDSVHRIIEYFNESNERVLPQNGTSAMVVEYCGRHCRGGCEKGCQTGDVAPTETVLVRKGETVNHRGEKIEDR